jgi:hypothetical protein
VELSFLYEDNPYLDFGLLRDGAIIVASFSINFGIELNQRANPLFLDV